MPSLNPRLDKINVSATLSLVPDAMKITGKEKSELVIASAGQLDGNPSPEVRSAVSKAASGNSAKYPFFAGINELRDAVAEEVSVEAGIKFSRDDVVVGNGGKGVLDTTIRTIANPGKYMLIFEPFWGSHANMAKIEGMIPLFVKGNPIDHKELESTLKKHGQNIQAVMWEENNPTGGPNSTEESIKQTFELIEKYTDAWIIQDALYRKLNFKNLDLEKLERAGAIVRIEKDEEGKDGSDILIDDYFPLVDGDYVVGEKYVVGNECAFANEFKVATLKDFVIKNSTPNLAKHLKKPENLITIIGASKEGDMTGWRQGAAVSSNKKLMQKVYALQSQVSSGSPEPMQQGYYAHLTNPESAKHLVNTLLRLKLSHDALYERINQIEGLDPNKPESAMYLWVKHNFTGRKYEGPDVMKGDEVILKSGQILETDKDIANFLVAEESLVVVPGQGSLRPGSGGGHLRVTHSGGNVDAIANRLEAGVQKLAKFEKDRSFHAEPANINIPQGNGAVDLELTVHERELDTTGISRVIRWQMNALAGSRTA